VAWEGTCSREGERLEEDGGESKGKGREGWGRTPCLPSQSHNSTFCIYPWKVWKSDLSYRSLGVHSDCVLSQSQTSTCSRVPKGPKCVIFSSLLYYCSYNNMPVDSFKDKQCCNTYAMLLKFSDVNNFHQ